MNRRKLLRLAFALPLAGCGGGWQAGLGPIKGGGGTETGDIPTRAVSGTLSLPSGFPVALSDLRVETALGGESVGASGGFTVPVSTTETSPTLAYVRSGDNALLLGFLTPGGTLSIRSTAVALLYFGLGGYTFATSSKAKILSLIEAHRTVGPLTDVLTARLTANPLALNTEDVQIAAALKIALDTLQAERPKNRATAVLPMSHRATRAAGTALLLTSPTTPQSNLELTQGTAPQSIVVTNRSRRYCQLYVYETGKKPKGGTATVYPKAKIVTTARLSSTAALSIGGTLFGAHSGQTAFVPVSSEPIALTMANGAEKTTFETVVLGSSSILFEPAIYSDPHYADEVEGWRDTRELLNVISWLVDVAFNLVMEFWGLRDLPINAAEIERAANILRRVKIRSWRRVNDAVKAGNGGEVVQLFLELCTSDNEFFRAFVAILAILNPTINKALTSGVIANSGKLIMKLLLAPLNLVGVVLGIGDIGAVLFDLANGEPAERWSATLFTSDVTLSPASATISPGDSQVLTANVPAVPGTKFVYKWSLTGSNLANLSDGKEGKVGTSFETAGSVVTLATTPSTDGTLTVGVEAFEIGTDGSRSSRGQAVSKITVSDKVPFGSVRVVFDGKTRLLPKYSTQRLAGTTGLAIAALYQQVSTAYGGTVALKLILQFSTKTLSVGSTASVVSDYDLTYELPDGNNSLYFAPSAKGTLTVTEVGTGYFGYTLSVNLKGLRGVPTTGLATFKGWVTED